MITRQLTQLESDLAAKDELIVIAGEAANHIAAVLKSTNERFWSLPTDRLLEVLNYDIPATLEMFRTNTNLGTAINESLNLLGLPQFTNRAPTEPGRLDITFDQATMRFALVIPEPTEPIE